jgi:hypothetical protein
MDTHSRRTRVVEGVENIHAERPPKCRRCRQDRVQYKNLETMIL